jgi:hypothetical protein
MTAEKIAKPVVKNKFWVVEDQGTKIATIQAKDDGGFVYVHDNQREYFPSVQILKKKYNIKFGTANKVNKIKSNSVYGFPISGKSFNQVYDVKRKLPIYTKTSKSRSLFCAGYYLINLADSWTETFCPKNITLTRYKYLGPFKTQQEMSAIYKELQNATAQYSSTEFQQSSKTDESDQQQTTGAKC